MRATIARSLRRAASARQARSKRCHRGDRRAPRPSCAGTACPCRGRSGCGSRLPTAIRPMPGSGSSALDCTSSARTPYSSACLSGCRRPQIGSPSASASRNGARRASSAGDRPAASRRRRGPRPARTARCAPGRPGNPRPATRPSRAACRRRCPARISASASWCVRTARRSFSCALANNSCRRRDELAVLVAQHFELVAGQRRGRAVLARHHHADRQVGELLAGTSDAGAARRRLRARRVFRWSSFALMRNHSPSNTNAAGPAMVIGAGVVAARRCCNSPPGRRTATSRSTRPRRIRIAAAAQAPLPQASVSPTPRSYTRRRMRSRASTCAKPTLTDSGNAALRLQRGAERRRPARDAMSSTSTSACGLPIDAAPKRSVSPSTSSA